MFKHKKTVDYVSDIDRYMLEFDRTHAPSKSQLAEVAKYQRVYELRDYDVGVEKDLELAEKIYTHSS